MSFLAPLILAGLGLAAIPWLIHLIRRPEREEVRFGSLMFVPRITKEVIERRKLQHILLMLLRMLLVAFLALAFSRPFFPAREQTFAITEAGARHLIMLDYSYSMGLASNFEKAIAAAQNALAEIPETEEVGIAVFGESSSMIFAPENGGGRALARAALADVRPVWQTTNYRAALQYGENRLLAGLSAEKPKDYRLVLHMISDFQKAGVTEIEQPWRLSALITFKSYPAAPDPEPNLSLTEIGIRPLDEGGFSISGKVKNWSENDIERVPVKLTIEDQTVAEKTIAVNAGNATRVMFQVDGVKGRFISGWLEIGRDGFEPDNRRYFVWRPPRALDILLIAESPKDAVYPAEWFMKMALEGKSRITRMSQDQWLAAGGSELKPDLVIVSDLTEFKAETGKTLLDFANQGGHVLFTLGSHKDRTAMVGFLADLGIEHQGLRFEEMQPARYDGWSRVAFDHPVFSPFQGARFNDFSQIRFYNYHRLTIKDPDKAAVIAQFGQRDDSAAPPACLDVRQGSGRLIVWAFTPNLEWTNLTKDIKFVPFLHETVDYLAGREREIKPYLIGQSYSLGQWPAGASIQFPGASTPVPAGSGAVPVQQTGFIKLAQDDDSPRQIVDAVNLDTRESDPETFAPREFALKLTSNAAEPEEAPMGLSLAGSQDLTSKNEYGWFILIAVALFLALETWYAAWLSKRRAAIAASGPYLGAPAKGGI